MSEHRIEDLVEDGVRIILNSDRSDTEKARLAVRLYDFQARYDTSYTIGRLKPVLNAIGLRKRGAAGLPLLEAIEAIVLSPRVLRLIGAGHAECGHAIPLRSSCVMHRLV